MSPNRHVSREFIRNWGLHAVSSPLYHHLVAVVAEDDELFRVINRISNWPPPNLLFGAVHYLLLEGSSHELSEFFPSIVGSPRPFADAGPVFKAFVLANEEEIVEIGNARYTQTNECRRCVALLPGVMAAGPASFHLIEIGASAGLNLALDQYRYSWGDLEWGPDSDVVLESEARGRLPVTHDIEILSRVGLDLNPVDASNSEDRKWLEALIWPEHAERRQRLKAALDVVAVLDIELIAGDAVETVGPALSSLPDAEPVVLVDSFSLNQVSEEGRGRIDATVEVEREKRTVARVSLEPLADDAAALLKVDKGDGWRDLGRMQHHGEWVELYALP